MVFLKDQLILSLKKTENNQLFEFLRSKAILFSYKQHAKKLNFIKFTQEKGMKQIKIHRIMLKEKLYSATSMKLSENKTKKTICFVLENESQVWNFVIKKKHIRNGPIKINSRKIISIKFQQMKVFLKNIEEKQTQWNYRGKVQQNEIKAFLNPFPFRMGDEMTDCQQN